MKCLITGGAGFIGSHLCDALLAEGNNLTVVDNLSLGREKNIRHLIGNVNFKFVKQDLLDYEKMKEIFSKEKFDIVFHLAANSAIDKSRLDPSIDLNNTFMTTYNVLKLMREFDVKKIFFSSTSAIYGDTNKKIGEDFGPLLPVSHYGAAKLASEAFIYSFVENYGIQAWIARFPNVVGERATHGAIFDFVNKLKKNPEELEVLGNGEQNKPYLYVKELIKAIVFVCKNTNEKINIYNIGVDSRTKVRSIVKIVCEEMHLNPKVIFTGGDRGWIGDVPEFNYDLSKIHGLGWNSALSSDDSVRMAVRQIIASNR